jgi:O-antigen ligase
MNRSIAMTPINRAKWAHLADTMAAGVAVSLPWSVSATSILVVLWFIAVVPTLDWKEWRREIATPAGGLPIAFFVFGLLGMAWAEVSWSARLQGLESMLKLLVIPLLFVQFRNSSRWMWPLWGFLASTGILLLVSVASVVAPRSLWGLAKNPGVPVKDYIAQSGEFTLAAFGLFYLALMKWTAGARVAAGLLCICGLAFLADIVFIASSRTTLVTIPLLFALFALTQFRGKARIAAVLGGIVCLGIIWMSSGFVRDRLSAVVTEIRQYRTSNAATSAGERIEFWTKAIVLVNEAPVIGHGTGSIREIYRRAAEGRTGIGAEVASNPHNQTFAVALQLGLVGVVLLYAMWIAHLILFRGNGVAAWVGLLVVVQNVIGSLFNSHLFDFTQGWLYAFGVGIVGGAALAGADHTKAQGIARPS